MDRICPVCGKAYSEYPALSRRDNVTEICPTCGVNEAMIDYLNYVKGKTDADKRCSQSIRD